MNTPTHEPTRKRQSDFRADVLRLATGTGIGQLIGVLAAPIVTRLFAPDAYGLAAVFGSLTAILSIIACARYELAIVLPKKDSDAASLLWLSLLSAVFFALLTYALVVVFGTPLAASIGAPTLSQYLWLLPLAVFAQGVFNALNYWNTRTRHYTRLSIAEISSRVTGTATTIAGGVAGYATGGTMIIASIVGRILSTFLLGGQILRADGRFLISSFKFSAVIAGSRTHRNFPIYSSWSGLINVASWQLPVILLGVFFSPAIVGFYALGFRILQMPMSLVGRAIGRVFHQRAAETHADGHLEPLVRQLLVTLTIAGLAPIIVLTVIGEDVFSLAFGESWGQAGVYTQLLGPWALVWFVSSPLSTLFGVLDEQALGLRLQITIFFTRLASICAGGYFDSVILALALFSGTGIVVYGNLVWKIMRLSGVSVARLVDATMRKAFGLSLTVLIIMVSGQVLQLSSLLLVILGCVVVAGYYFFLRKEFSTAMTEELAK